MNKPEVCHIKEKIHNMIMVGNISEISHRSGLLDSVDVKIKNEVFNRLRMRDGVGERIFSIRIDIEMLIRRKIIKINSQERNK